MKMKLLTRSILIIVLILLADQLLKIYIKTNYLIGEQTPIIGDFFRLQFIENPGMAFGMRFGGEWGKLILTLFRLLAVIGIGWYILRLTKQKQSTFLIISLSMIFAGALGNIIDSMFYGLIFSASPIFYTMADPASFVGFGDGYGTFLHGEVVDMFQFNAFWPDWLPVIGGGSIFPPIFNLADSAITFGVAFLVVHQIKIIRKDKKDKKLVKNTEINT